MGTIPVAAPPVDQLRKTLAGFPYGGEVAEMVLEAYPPGVTFGAGFQALLQKLLAKAGLLFVDPLDQAVRRPGRAGVASRAGRRRRTQAPAVGAQPGIGGGRVSRASARGTENVAGVLAGRRPADHAAAAERRLCFEGPALFGGATERPGGASFAQRAAAAGGAGLRAADGGVCGRPGGAGVCGAIAGAVRASAGADAGDAGAQLVHAAGCARGQVDGALRADDSELFPGRGRRARRDRARSWFRRGCCGSSKRSSRAPRNRWTGCATIW